MATFRGTSGDDRLTGTRGRDELFGLVGDDLLIGGRKADLLDGGFGEDTASYRQARSSVIADLSDPSGNDGEAEGDIYISIESLVGSKFDDELRGGVTDSTLFGGRGDDTLIGQFATTVLVGGRGADTLIGLGVSTIASYSNAGDGLRAYLTDPGRNTGDAEGDVYDNINGLEGSEFSDRLYGDNRDNQLAGGDGRDRLYGGSGSDRLIGGDGRDLLDGGRGLDTAVYLGARSGLTVDLQRPDRNSGDARRDTFVDVEGIEGSQFDDRLYGDGGDNRIGGSLGADRISGRSGDDSLFGSLGDDRLSGGGGDDILSGGLGGDRFKGGGGFDKTIYWTASSGLTVDLQRTANNTGEARGDSFDGVEGIDGSNFSDILRGDGEDNRLSGRDGDDRLDGRDGDDTLFGGRGDDDLRGGDDADTLMGGEGDDALFGGRGSDTATYGAATEAVTADLSDPDANTGEAAGDDYSSIENLTGSSEADTLSGDGDANRLAGGGGDDRLEGGDGDDTLLGQGGDDTLIGGDGDDTLSGAEGRDELRGGDGDDTFVFNTAPVTRAVDAILDFELGADIIALGRFQFGGLPAGDLDADAFHLGATATEAGHRILYDDAGGALLFDADGDGDDAAIRFATIDESLALSAEDFVLV